MGKYKHYIPQQVILSGAPATPDSGYVKFYRKTDGSWYELGSDGIEMPRIVAPIVFTQPAIVTHSAGTANASTTAVNTNFNIVTSGNYMMDLSFNYNIDINNSDLVIYSTFNGNPLDLNDRSGDPQGVNQILRTEVKDNANGPAGAITGSGSGQKYAYSKQFYLTGLTTGNLPLVIDVGTEAANVEGSIWNVVATLNYISR